MHPAGKLSHQILINFPQRSLMWSFNIWLKWRYLLSTSTYRSRFFSWFVSATVSMYFPSAVVSWLLLCLMWHWALQH